MKKEITTNQVTGGLVLDLNPLITPNNVLTNCLNGTLITFNGNEQMLQNDMGNGRVETAMLPEGYIPLGTCSHGGFIYIVSYNPIKNLAQIGSFPSPERNIDTTEMDNQGVQSLQDTDMYLEGNDNLKIVLATIKDDKFTLNNIEYTITDNSITKKVQKENSEELENEEVATISNSTFILNNVTYIIDNDNIIELYHPLKPLVRKIFDAVELNPGDKFIVFANDLYGKYLTDYNITNNVIDSIPRLWKIRLASIQDNKTTELENLKWYNTGIETEGEDLSEENQTATTNQNKGAGNYYVKEIQSNLVDREDTKVDIDDYRSLVNGAYSVFSSKKSGKLALLISPECPDTFTSTWNAYVPEIQNLALSNEQDQTTYDIFINSSWDNGDRDVNPEGIIVRFKKPTKVDIQGTYTPDSNGYYIKKIPFNLSRNQSTDSVKWIDQQIQLGDSLLPVEISQNTYLSSDNRITKNQWYSTLQTDLSLNEDSNENNDIVFINNRYIHRIYENSYPKLSGNQSTYYISVDENDFNHPNNEEKHDDYRENELKSSGYYKGIVYDDHLNNYFHTDVPYKLNSFTVSTNLIDGDPNAIMEVEVYPYTEAGYFPHLKRTLTIDFSKLGKENVKLKTWKYWVGEDTEMISWSLDAYTLPNETISKVWLEFYDNQGLCATQILDGLSSYNGEFQTNINFGTSSVYHGITSQGIDEGSGLPNDKLIEHKGIEIDSNTINNIESLKKLFSIKDEKCTNKQYFIDNKLIIEEDNKYYANDAGIIYPNILYGVKLNYTTQQLSTFGGKESGVNPIATRWLWTCPVFNDKYNLTQDFKELQPELQLDINVSYGSTETYKAELFNKFNGKNVSEHGLDEYYNENTQTWEPASEEQKRINYQNQLGANIQYISGVNNIESKAILVLQNNYNTFRFKNDKIINQDGTESNETYLKYFKINCFTSEWDAKINKSISQPNIIQEEISGDTSMIYSSENLAHSLLTKPSSDITSTTGNVYYFKLSIPDNIKNSDNSKITFYSYTDEDPIQTKSFSDSTTQSPDLQGVVTNNFTFNAINYSKYYVTGQNSDWKTLLICKTPVVNESDLIKYNLKITSDIPHFTKYIYIGFDKKNNSGSGRKTNYYIGQGNCSLQTISSMYLDSTTLSEEHINEQGEKPLSEFYSELPEAISTICEKFNLFFPVIVGSQYADGRNYIETDGNKQDYRDDIGALCKVNGTFDKKHLGGFLGVVSKNNIVCDFNNVVASNTNSFFKQHGTPFTFYAKLLLGLLTQIYYNTGEPTSKLLYSFDNYTYYENHTCDYLTNVVYQIKCESDNPNELILLGIDNFGKGISYLEYLNKLSTSSSIPISDDDKNINFKINDLVKNCPIQFQFNYIQPELIKNNFNNKCIVESPTNLNGKLVECNTNVLYVENPESVNNLDKLIPLSSLSQFKPVQNIKDSQLTFVTTTTFGDQISGNTILPNFSTFLGDNYLEINSGVLKIKENIESLTNILTNVKISTDDGHKITNPTSINFFTFNTSN